MRIAFLFFISLLSFGCTAPVILEAEEIRDYEGERLDSINDFRENSIKGPQFIDIAGYNLAVDGLVEKPFNSTYEQVLERQRYGKIVTLFCVEGWDAKILWEGVLVRDLIEEARPLPKADTVIFYAYDGYTTSLPLQYFYDRDILLAHKMNNATIVPERGFPFQLVAEDKWGYKWIKWVTRIELSDNASYKGYWEEAGYSNSGDLDEPSIG
jgi:DMSO/TMAO reductase YedYZ molybdopterin-dependent catalytic subunit